MAIENWPETGRIPVYLVGGAVRDRLLGRTPREYDFAFDADEATFLQRNPEARKVGKSVSVFLLRGQEFMPLEGTLEEDMRRRDLTINALAEDRDGNLLGHPDALSDLREGILRPASPTSFRDEPVRVFRLARMACELPSFMVHPEAVAQMRAVAGEGLLGRIPAERVGRELMKALASPKPSRWLSVLAEGNCLSPWFRELETSMDIPAGPVAYHSGSVMAHLMDVMDAVAGDPLCVWMALCHDLGKIGTDPALLPHHYGHELRGAEPAEHVAKRLALPARYGAAGVLSSQLHMKAGIYEMLRAGTRCDLLMQVHNAELDGRSGNWPKPTAGVRCVLSSMTILLCCSGFHCLRSGGTGARSPEGGSGRCVVRPSPCIWRSANGRMPMADGAGMAGAPLDVSGRKPGAAGGIHAVDSDAAVVVDAVHAAQGVRVVDSSGLNHILPVEAGQTLAQTIWLSGELSPPALCSGLGRCGACRVRFLEGTPEPCDADSAILGADAVRGGWRLACRHAARCGYGC